MYPRKDCVSVIISNDCFGEFDKAIFGGFKTILCIDRFHDRTEKFRAVSQRSQP